MVRMNQCFVNLAMAARTTVAACRDGDTLSFSVGSLAGVMFT